MAQTLTDIANLALDLIGQKSIGNIDAERHPAPLCKRQLTEAIKAEQIDFTWPELKTRVALQSAEQNDLYPDATLYNLPTNILKINGLVSGSTYEIIGSDLLTQDTAPVLQYTRNDTNPAEWSTWLTEIIVTALAMRTALPITQDAQMYSLAAEAYRKAFGKRTKVKSGTESATYRPNHRPSLSDARRGY